MIELMHYILIDRRVVECADLMQWAKWFEMSRKDDSFRVAETTVADFWVSTVFLGLNHNFGMSGPPVLFETMVFSQKDDLRTDETMRRYCTFEEAERGHNALVEMLQTFETNSLEITRATLAVVKAGLDEHMKKKE